MKVAQSVWSLEIDGQTYDARPVSARLVADLVPKLMEAKGTEAFPLLEQLFRAAYPWRLSYVWRGDPVKRIMALSPHQFREVRDSFFGYLGTGHVPETNGTP